MRAFSFFNSYCFDRQCKGEVGVIDTLANFMATLFSFGKEAKGELLGGFSWSGKRIPRVAKVE